MQSCLTKLVFENENYGKNDWSPLNFQQGFFLLNNSPEFEKIFLFRKVKKIRFWIRMVFWWIRKFFFFPQLFRSSHKSKSIEDNSASKIIPQSSKTKERIKKKIKKLCFVNRIRYSTVAYWNCSSSSLRNNMNFTYCWQWCFRSRCSWYA